MYADFGLLVLRVVAGAVVLAHGLQKLGYLGGHGFEGTAGFINGLGFRPSRPWTAAVVVAEVIGSALMILGLGGPIGPGLVAADLLVAIAVVHVPKGWWNANGGVEYVAVIAASALAVRPDRGGRLLRGRPSRPDVRDVARPGLARADGDRRHRRAGQPDGRHEAAASS